MTGHKAIVLFYRYFIPEECPNIFTENADLYVDRLQAFQRTLCRQLGCRGRILVSTEGINGTLSGENPAVIQQYVDIMKGFHLVRDCGLPDGDNENKNQAEVDDARLLFFANVDWKESSVDEADNIEPFPDLKVSIVKEIVSTGGKINVDAIPGGTGKHLTPRQFHDAISDKSKPVVLVDVRNTFEHDIGHFVNPNNGEAAMNPEMVTFSSFDTGFCEKNANYLKDKKVLMYCTGGVRCEKATVMLRNRGVEDVSQLSGGIHRYLETFGNDGHYKGLNFVFDQRVAMRPDPKLPQNEVVGRCIECDIPFDEICGSRVCTVCRDLVLVCHQCQCKLREYHCRRHSSWKHCYFTFLETYNEDDLKKQTAELEQLHDSLLPASEHRNQRRTISRQINKISERLQLLQLGLVRENPAALRRCRTCMEPSTECDGRCWGFWKLKAGRSNISPGAILPVAIGDIVEPSDHWNVLKLGEKTDTSGNPKRGRVTDIKGWTGENEDDCVAVMWESEMRRGRNQSREQPRIYRWGVVAMDGTRRYDVRKVE
eukprot:Nitzschia sp. Nitz4//scaffold378_size14206//5794//7416//NITZ4_008949-RA/size14206-processed-gene-0.15-mRNA-1//-1//CDS//3329549693//5212//frame0